MWLAAFSLRHTVRWYRVRRLHETDVPALVRLVKAHGSATVGFVVDDLGRQDRAGFDHLVDELRGSENAALLAACLEEDLFLVRSAPGSVQVRPVLVPELAERIWHELHEGGGTSWAAWREPFEASERLLLEYGYLLTAGRRLADTITAQVDERIRDRRDLELDVLALVSIADAFGADIGIAQLASAVGVDRPTMKSALTRLIDEHLIHEDGGVLSGLHEVRSRHLMAAVHRVPPPTLSDSIRRVTQLVPSSALQPFLTRLPLGAPASADVVLDAVVERLEHDTDLPALAGTLHALRVVGFRRSAESWRAIADEEGAAPTDIAVISHFVLHSGDYSIFPPAIRSTIDRLREVESMDLREALLPRIRDVVSRALATASDMPSVITVLAALGELGESIQIDGGQLAGLASAAPLTDVRSLLTAAYAAFPLLAAAIAEGLGGPGALLERLQVEQPWVRRARLGTAVDGRTTAEADYAFVAASAQPDPHGAVVELARWLLALAPAADVAVSRAVDARGETAGFGGVPIADKRIDRDNLPNAAAIAWNRARARAAVAVVAAPTTTEYAIAARDLVEKTRHVLHGVANAYARGKKPPQPLVADAMALIVAANAFRPSPLAVEAAGPLDEGDYPETDPVAFVANVISNNLVPRLFEGANVAPLIDQIVKKVDDATACLEVSRQVADDGPRRDARHLRRPPSCDTRAASFQRRTFRSSGSRQEGTDTRGGGSSPSLGGARERVG